MWLFVAGVSPKATIRGHVLTSFGYFLQLNQLKHKNKNNMIDPLTEGSKHKNITIFYCYFWTITCDYFLPRKRLFVTVLGFSEFSQTRFGYTLESVRGIENTCTVLWIFFFKAGVLKRIRRCLRNRRSFIWSRQVETSYKLTNWAFKIII